jgi:zinc transport system ATP-binding protein
MVPMKIPRVLEARGVSHAFDHERVLDDVSLSIAPGEFCALVGPNGSGKSTLVRILVGLLQPDRGEVRCLGEDPRHVPDRWRIGYVPQRHALAPALPATVEEVVTTGRLARRGWWRRSSVDDREAVRHALEAVALERFADRAVGTLSGGEQQRVLIAKALASEPQLLVLDEPVAGVDAISQQEFRDSVVHEVRDHDAAVLLVTHELGAVAADLDHVIVLKRSVVFDGTPDDLAARGVSLGVHADDLPLWLERLA